MADALWQVQTPSAEAPSGRSNAASLRALCYGRRRPCMLDMEPCEARPSLALSPMARCPSRGVCGRARVSLRCLRSPLPMGMSTCGWTSDPGSVFISSLLRLDGFVS
eukprot:2251869-Alexandrium_andersonii.AAC.1